MRPRHRSRDERGFVGGVEVVALGMLVFVVGLLIVANAWAVVDAKSAAVAAAREAARTYVEAPDAETAGEDAHDAAVRAIEGHGRDPARMDVAVVSGGFARCARVTIEVRYRVPLAAIPVVGRVGGDVTAAARHSEVVDPYRSGLDGEARCD